MNKIRRWNRGIDKFRGPTVTIYENNLDELEAERDDLQTKNEQCKTVIEVQHERLERLEAERDENQNRMNVLSTKNGILRQRIAELEAERDAVTDVRARAKHMELGLIGDLHAAQGGQGALKAENELLRYRIENDGKKILILRKGQTELAKALKTLETGTRILKADNERLETLCTRLRDALAKQQQN